MTETEIVTISPPSESPDWFKRWARDRNYLFSKISSALSKRLTLKSNISSRVLETQVSDGVPVFLRHELGRKPDFSQLGTGRVRFFKTVLSDSSVVQIVPYLAQTVTVESDVRLVNKIEVADASWMRVGDILKINGKKFTVRNIANNVVTLSNVVNLKKVRSVTLASDSVTFLIL